MNEDARYLVIHPTRGIVIALIPDTGFICSKDMGAGLMFQNSVYELPVATQEYVDKFPTDNGGNEMRYVECKYTNTKDIWMHHPEIIEETGLAAMIWCAGERKN